MASSCLFCGASGAGVLSNEHVIAQWLLEHLDLPADDKLFQGVVLRQLHAKYAHQLDTRSGKRPLGIGPSMRLLSDAGIIEAGDVQTVHRATEIRNRAVHDLSEPSAQDVQFMLNVVREFKTKYLG